MFALDRAPRFACRLCSFEGSTAADSHGSNSDGNSGAGYGGGSAYGGSDAGSGVASDTPGASGPSWSAPPEPSLIEQVTAPINSLIDKLTGAPRTGDPVADTFITGLLSAIPGANLALGVVNNARDWGWSVTEADLPSSPSAGADLYQGFTPYRTGSTNPFASQATPQASTAWAPQGAPVLDPYMLPQASPAAALAAPSAGSGAIASVDPYKAPEKPSWPLLLVAAGILAGLTL